MSIRKGTTIIAGNTSSLDWTGTLAEYNIALENGTIKENMVCYITDDTLYTDDIRPEIETLNNIKANKDLSNLSEVGEKHFLNKSQITNCITEIPQRIKLELNDGVLTLKAGSEVIVPNGFEADGVTPKFDYMTVESDTTFQGASTQTGSYIVSLNMDNKSIGWHLGANAGSGTETSSTSGFYYRTDLNEIYYKNDTSSAKYCFPFCFVNMSSGVITSINQVFNGIGYIGSTIWVDKGVKCLIPNGRNDDGSLKNIEHTTPKVATYANMHAWSGTHTLNITISTGNYLGGQDINRFSEDKELVGTITYSYNSEDNSWYYTTNSGTTWTKQSITILGTITETSTDKSVSDFSPKQPFRAVDYSDSSTVSGWGMPSNKEVALTFGASGSTYTAPANGYLKAYITSTGSASTWAYINVINMDNSLISRNGNWHANTASSYTTVAFLPMLKGQTARIDYATATNVTDKTLTFVYAQGEV